MQASLLANPTAKVVIWPLLLTLSALIASAVLSLMTGGRSDVGLGAVVRVMASDADALTVSVVRDIRLPRTLCAALLGAGLGVAGLVLQAITRNPLASPGILGINQGAAFGLTLALLVPGIAAPGVMATVGAFGAGCLTFAIAGGFTGRLDPMRVVLGGVAVGALGYALVRFAYTLDDELTHQVVRWTVGDITDMRWPPVLRLMALTLPASLAAWAMAHRLNLMALGQAASRGLGADPRLTLLLGALIAAVLSGAAVSVAGPIAFAGVIVPHIARRLFGQDHRALVPACLLTGAALLLCADGVSKLLNPVSEIPLGIVSALIGAPWFLWQAIYNRELF